jgi:ribonuclease P protein component
MKRFSFPKKKRLVSNKQFEAVLARGLRASNGLLTLYMAENDCGYPRLGVSVGKSHGNAVVRNRLKRLLREVFRQNQDRIPAGFDYLLMISAQWSKNLDRAVAAKEAVRQGSRLTGTQPTFEQVRGSFLALVAAEVGKRNQKLKCKNQNDI